MGTGSFPGLKYGRGVLLTTHPLLVPRSWKSRAIPLPTLWATTRPVTGTLYIKLSKCLAVNFSQYLTYCSYSFTDLAEIIAARTVARQRHKPYHIQPIQHLEPVDICSRLKLCRWINSNSHMVRNILLTDEAHFTCDGANNTRNSHLWDPHGTVESNYQHRFSVYVWCGVIGDQLIGPYIFPQRLTGDIYTTFLQDELPALLENVPLQT